MKGLSSPDAAEALLQAAFLARDNAVFVVEYESRRILAIGENVERIFGYTPEELRGATTEGLHVDEEGFRRFGQLTESAFRSGQDTFHCYYRMRRKDGTAFNTENLLGLIRDESGNPVAAVSVVRDLSEQTPLSKPGAGEDIDFRALSDNLPGAVFQRVRKPDGSIFYTFLRGDLLRYFDLPAQENLEDPTLVLQRLHPDDRQRLEYALETTATSLSTLDIELRACLKDGSVRRLRSISQPRSLDDDSTVWDGILLDITDQRRAEDDLRYTHAYDRLTDLPNATTFNQRLEEAIAEAHRTGRRLLVATADIDRFHAVNTSLGFGYGDLALRRIGERFESMTGTGDLTARDQGDQFLLLFHDIGDQEEATKLAQRLINVFDAPLDLDEGHRYNVNARLGLAIFPDDGDDPEALRRSADLALRRARTGSVPGYAFYSQEMTTQLLQSLAMERALAEAIRNRQIEPYYQGQYSLRNGALVGIESLARWQREDGTYVSPGEFIPLAENTGLIHDLGDLLLYRVLADIREWRDRGVTVPPVAVNLSTVQAGDADLLPWLYTALDRHCLDPDDLTIEVTESVFLFDFEGAKALFEEMDAHSLGLSIDDFGTGFSSLSYLAQLPFRELKIDRSFVTGLDNDHRKCAITRGIIELAHAIGLTVIAEGVETEAELAQLRSIGCDVVQGYLFQKPVNAESFFEAVATPPRHGVDPLQWTP